MDGPYRIDVTQNGEELLLKGVCFRNEPQVQLACACTYRELQRESLMAFNRLEKMFFPNSAFHNKCICMIFGMIRNGTKKSFKCKET